MRLIRFRVDGGEPQTGVTAADGARPAVITPLPTVPALAGLLALPLSRMREICAAPGGCDRA